MALVNDIYLVNCLLPKPNKVTDPIAMGWYLDLVTFYDTPTHKKTLGAISEGTALTDYVNDIDMNSQELQSDLSGFVQWKGVISEVDLDNDWLRVIEFKFAQAERNDPPEAPSPVNYNSISFRGRFDDVQKQSGVDLNVVVNWFIRRI